VIDAIQGGDMDLAEFTGGQIGELPIHPYTEEGEKVVKSFAEAWLSDRAVERLRRAGLLPVAPVKNSDTIHLAHLGSVAATPMALHLGR
jgi:predicted component of type VI protein secretion system